MEEKLKKICCIGGIDADIICSPVPAFPPMGKGITLDSMRFTIGGCAGNTALDLARLGVGSILFCKLGEDQMGRSVLKELMDVGVDVRGIHLDTEVETGVSIVMVDPVSGERTFFYTPFSSTYFESRDIDLEIADESDIVFVGGALQLERFDGFPCAAFLRRARERGQITAMDTGWDTTGRWLPSIQAALPFVDFFMPSFDEAVELAGGERDPEAMARFFQSLGVANVVIKMGKKGAFVRDALGSMFIAPAYSGVKAVDTTGAGDSFCAGFLTGLELGYDLKGCAVLANAVASFCVQAHSAYGGIPPLSDVLAFKERQEHDYYIELL
ncbi:carbohydrate kinase family protein [Zongyangia hominis]|uniref:Carbohydrate kinase family protein n=1 Tax=Zongyangia hominis TaxID=2763677 RepID=A0A926IB53_9FIRM|nr:carbohydrate kinase family protein [Zongyangia hominis]MBC8570886.1 carbohydrate kinase family protein [Zongyangia hominis]